MVECLFSVCKGWAPLSVPQTNKQQQKIHPSFFRGLIAHFFISLNDMLLCNGPLFVYPFTVEEYLACSQFRVVMSEAAINIHMKVFM